MAYSRYRVASQLKKILREPLLHFLLLGAAIFVAYSLVSRPNSAEPGKIVITQGQLASMMETFTLARQRPPTREELEGLIRERVRRKYITARRWRWAWTRTTSSSAAACSRRCNSSPTTSPPRSSQPTPS